MIRSIYEKKMIAIISSILVKQSTIKKEKYSMLTS